jgi:hypothetical protein
MVIKCADLGEAVQLDPIRRTLKAPGTKRLKLKCDKMLSILLQFCFQFQLAPLHLGHCALPLAAHKKWVGALEEEFFAQGDAERDADMPVSALMAGAYTRPLLSSIGAVSDTKYTQKPMNTT